MPKRSSMRMTTLYSLQAHTGKFTLDAPWHRHLVCDHHRQDACATQCWSTLFIYSIAPVLR